MFEIRFSEDADRHLGGLSARDRKIVIAAIEE
jgi:mRNA-degrading endonuclease RelE of RelBE toxin-antitoxin system